MLVKKIDPTWKPKENLELGVGESIEISDPYRLLKEGKVVLVDAKGFELPRVQELMCPICVYTASDVKDLSDHLNSHNTVKVEKPEAVKVPEGVSEKEPDYETRCSQCGFQAATKPGLSSHMRNQHKNLE